jgi:hypothetical protein
MFGNDRAQMRRVYIEAWRKHREGLPASPLETAIGELIVIHPEYHRLLESPDEGVDREYPPENGESNPFLHLAMHLGLREQVATDRPQGIAEIHRRLCHGLGDRHEAEHLMMECLAEAIWKAQRSQRPPDEAAYLACLGRLAR